MALNETALAQDIADAMGFPTVSAQLVGWSKGVIEEVKKGVATFGNIPTPHPISGIVGSSMASLITNYAGYGTTSPELTSFCNGIATHIVTSGVVTYTSPVPAPPAIMPPAAWFLGGTISGLSGGAMASMVQTMVGFPSVSSKLLAECTAIADHIMNNAEVVSGVIS